MASSVDSDQTPRSAASDLGLHCLLRHVCPWDKSGPLSMPENLTGLTSLDFSDIMSWFFSERSDYGVIDTKLWRRLHTELNNN